MGCKPLMSGWKRSIATSDLWAGCAIVLFVILMVGLAWMFIGLATWKGLSGAG